MPAFQHQYVERSTGRAVDERPIGDGMVNLLYSEVRENAPFLFRMATSAWATSLLGLFSYDIPFTGIRGGQGGFARRCGIDLTECLESGGGLATPRKVFERKIRYRELRPMPEDPATIVAPSDSRVVLGSFSETSRILLKGKFFEFEELLGAYRDGWLRAFEGGDFAVFRLTPEKYHYNHVPASGFVADFYEIDGSYHSCNPGAVVRLVTPFSKNCRSVTIIDTDVDGGSGAGLVAMVEVVAMMVGEIEQRYSEDLYRDPKPITPGSFLCRGQPKSLFRPGSSTVVLIFQRGRVRFSEDLLAHQARRDVASRYTLGFGKPLVETEVAVRSAIGRAAEASSTTEGS